MFPILLGVQVLFGSSMIYQGEYKTYLDNVDYIEVIETLVMEGVKWEFSSGRYKSFHAKFLSKVFYIWKFFVCSKLMPTTHYNSMDKE